MNDQPNQLSHDDPRLTAYALGELTGEERAAVAAAVSADPALAAEVNRLRTFSAQLRVTLAAEPAPALSLQNEVTADVAPLPASAQAAAPTAQPPHRAKIIRGPFFYWLATAAAACFAVIVWLQNPPAPSVMPPRVVKVNRVDTPPTLATDTQAPGAASGKSAPTQPPAPVATARAMTIAESLGQPTPPAAPVAPALNQAGNSAFTFSGGGATADPNASAQGFDKTKDIFGGAGGPTTVAPLDTGSLTLGSGTAPVGASNLTLDGGGTLTKAGTGTLTLSGANTNTGGTTVSGGILSVGGSISGNADLTKAGSGQLVLNGGTLTYTGGATGPSLATATPPTVGAPARGGARGGAAGAAGAGAAGGRRGGAGGAAPAGAGVAGAGAARGGGGGRRTAAPPTSSTQITITQQPVIIKVGAGPDDLYRYPSLPPDRIIVRRPPPPPAPYVASGEGYDRLLDNAFTDPAQAPLSTFSLDVDTASYANVRRFLKPADGQRAQLPPPNAVRIEELVNYFPYRYASLPAAVPASVGGARPPAAPFGLNLEVTSAPWQPSHRLVRVALKARDVSAAQRGAANLVFLVDVSGSMAPENRLPLVKESLHLLLSRLRADDRVAIVTYANGSDLALPSTPVAQRGRIEDAIDSLRAEGGTNGGEGIQRAYQVASENFNREGINRIILCTDGDFNVGTTGAALTSMVADRAKGGVFLTVLGFGMGNLKDNTLEHLADSGNGHYGYIDTRQEAQKLFVEQLSGTLVTVAKDVKIQVEFNPSRVAAYRLIGYEDRLLRAQDFNNDQVDAGDIGAGHTVTALYEIVPVGADYGYPTAPGVDALRYTETTAPAARTDAARPAAGANSPELLNVKVRYKLPTADVSQKLEYPLVDRGAKFEAAGADFQFAAAVAGFGMVLRDSPYRGGTTLSDVLAWAERGAADDAGGYRAEFMELVRRARDLRREPTGGPYPAQGGSVDPLRY